MARCLGNGVRGGENERLRAARELDKLRVRESRDGVQCAGEECDTRTEGDRGQGRARGNDEDL